MSYVAGTRSYGFLTTVDRPLNYLLEAQHAFWYFPRTVGRGRNYQCVSFWGGLD
jgi:hypothetical protein